MKKIHSSPSNWKEGYLSILASIFSPFPLHLSFHQVQKDVPVQAAQSPTCKFLAIGRRHVLQSCWPNFGFAHRKFAIDTKGGAE